MFDRLRNQLAARAPDIHPRMWPDIGDPDDIGYAATWMAPENFFAPLKKLKAIFALSAGVDRLLADPHVPKHIPVIRLEDAGMAELMEQYVLYGVLHAHRSFLALNSHQADSCWDRDYTVTPASRTRVSILGAGVLGKRVAVRLRDNGYAASCWSRTERQLPNGIGGCCGTDALYTLAGCSDILVCLLPLTSDTRDILDKKLFEAMPDGAFLINAARGEHLVEHDLLVALRSDKLAGALLDVFRTEPLPAEHPFWSEPGITVTPHIAAPSQAEATASCIVDSLIMLREGKSPGGLVDRELGY